MANKSDSESDHTAFGLLKPLVGAGCNIAYLQKVKGWQHFRVLVRSFSAFLVILAKHS